MLPRTQLYIQYIGPSSKSFTRGKVYLVLGDTANLWYLRADTGKITAWSKDWFKTVK